MGEQRSSLSMLRIINAVSETQRARVFDTLNNGGINRDETAINEIIDQWSFSKRNINDQ